MNVAALINWAKALESGDFKQGLKDYICEDGSVCALGVLARINGVTGNSITFAFGDEGINPNHWLASLVGSYDVILEVNALNESDKLTFPQIANHIRRLAIGNQR